MLFNINIEIGWLIGIGALALVGIVLAIIFRKSEIFKVNKECEFDGYLIHRAVIFEIFFILLIITLASTVATLNIDFILEAIFGYIDYLYLALMQIPIGAFIAVMLLYNHQMHHIFKAKVEASLLEDISSEDTETEVLLEELANTEENEENNK